MEGAHRRSIEPQETSALEHAIDDRLGQILVVEHSPPRFQRFVRREDHRPMPAMTLIDHVKEHVGGVGAIGEIADFVDDKDNRVRVRRQRVRQLARPERGREVVDQRRSGREEGIEAVLNRAVGDGDRQMRLPAARFARQNERSAFRDEIGTERRAQHLQAQRRLIREIEVVDRFQKGKVGSACQPGQSRLLAMGDFFGGEEREEIPVRPSLSLGPIDQPAPDPAGVRQVQPLEEGVEIGISRDHDRPPTRREDAAVLGPASRPSAALRPFGRLRRPGPDLRAAAWGRLS